MFKGFIKKLLGNKGISGVVVALMLVLIGVVALVGVSAFLKSQKDTIQNASSTAVNGIVANTN